MSELLDAKAFLSPTRVKTEELELPSGGRVRIRALDVGTRDRVLEIGSDVDSRRELSRLITAKCCIDAAGARIFDDEATEGLKTAPAEDVEMIAKTAMRLSGIRTVADEAAEDEAPND